MFWFIITFLIIILIATIVTNSNEQANPKTKIDNFKEQDITYDFSNKIDTGTYLIGHPQIDLSTEKTFIVKLNNDLLIFKESLTEGIVQLANIPINKIKNIQIEDQTSIEKRVTIGRLLLTGIFAFAWKKNVKKESSFLIIEWDGAKINNETIFVFSGKGSLNKANSSRNALINIINNF